MPDTYRIEIPVEVTNKTDAGVLQQLENALNKIQTTVKQTGSAAKTSFDMLENSAEKAGSSMDKAASAAEEVGDSASQAGKESGTAFNQAGNNADKFSQRIEKSNQSLRKMFAQKLQLTLEAIDKVSPILKGVSTSLKNLTSKAWHVAVKMTDFVTAPFRKLKSMIMSPIMMTLGITGIGMGASSFVSTFSDLTAGMSNVKALSGATNEEFIKLTETAEHLGATTKFTATEASQGMQYLAMAGWETNDIIAAMPGLLDLAAAGGTDLGVSADIVSDVMTAMGMSATEASTAADIFARTATSTNTTIENLGESLKYAAPVAHSFGLSLSEVSTITGMMANAGIKGSMAGTALRTSLLQMASPTKEASKAMKALGLSFSDDSGKMKDMKTIIRELGTAFSGLSDQEKLAYADDIFGTRGSSAWLSVIEQGTEAYEELFESIDKSKGAAKEMANTQLDNLTGDITLLNSALDGMKISVMNELSPALRDGVKWLTNQVPKLTEILTGFATKAIDKLKEVKENITNIFNSSDFQNAEGFADKFFIAWDKLIAEPFSKWWDGGGRETIVGAVSKLGGNLGEMYHGIITGIFAAIKGEEIDFDGLNITGLAKAGAEAAKSFITSFKGALNIGELFGDMPGILKAGLFGFAGLKVGSGVLGAAKTVSQLKLAFNGVKFAAGGATAATGSIATTTAAAAAGAGKFASVLGLVKTGLAAIPGWGWVAAAAIAAVTAGIYLHNKAQAEHEQALLDTGKAAKEYETEYVTTANRIKTAMDTMDEIKKIEIQIQENTGGNAEVIKKVQDDMASILDRTVYVTAVLATNKPGHLTEEKLKEYQEQLEIVKGQIAEVDAQLKSGTLTEQQVKDYQKQLEELKGVKADLEAAIKNKELTLKDVEQYQKDLESLLTGVTAELKVKLTNEGYNPVTAGLIIAEFSAIQSDTKELTLILADKTELTADQIEGYITELTTLMGIKTEKELFIYGSGLTPAEIKEYQRRFEAIKSRKAELEVIIQKGQGNMTDEQWASLVSEYESLTKEAGTIDIILQGSKANATEIANAKKQLEEVEGKAKGIVMSIAYDKESDLSQTDLNNISQILSNIGDHTFIATVGLRNAGMGEDEMQALIDKQNQLYRNMVETSGGVFTQRDVETGRITQEDFDWWIKDQAEKADIARLKFNNQVISDRGNIEELSERKDLALEQMESTSGAYERSKNNMKAIESAENEAIKYYELYNGGEGSISYDEYVGASNALLERLRNDIGFSNTVDFLGMTNLDFLQAFMTGDFSGWKKAFGDERNRYTEQYEGAQTKYNEADEALQRHYQNEVTMATQNATAGLGYESGLTTATIDQLASSFNHLDEAAQAAFADAVTGIALLNEDVDYIDIDKLVDLEKVIQTAKDAVTSETNAGLIVDTEAKIGGIKTYLETAENLPAAEVQENLQKVQSALDALGIDNVTVNSIEDIDKALEAIAGIDLTSLDFTAATASIEALGGSTDEAKKKVEEAKKKLDSLEGTYNVVINIQQNGSIPDNVNMSPANNAHGGIYDGAFLSWVAEDGPEAIIPLGADKRSRGLDLWMQAGEMLGINQFADGGIMAPFAGVLKDISDEMSGESVTLAAPVGGSEGKTIQITVTANPGYTIEGGDTEDIMATLKAHQYELAEMLGEAVADQLEDILSNVP